MTDSSPIIEAQLQRLLEIIDAYQNEECAKLLNETQNEAADTTRQAFREARIRVKQDIETSRQSIERAIATAKASVQTEEKQQQYIATQKYLEQSWQQLADLLKQRWKSPDTRRRWVDKAVNQALKVLPESTWQIEHPENWPEDERRALATQIRSSSRPTPDFVANKELAVGIRIIANGAIVDASIGGLMADRGRIEAELLARHHAMVTANND
jgi:hypothetical protein